MAAPCKIQLYGHSFVRRLKDFIRSNEDFTFTLNLEGPPLIQYSGFPGATIPRLKHHFDVVADFQPQLLLLFVGTNDLYYSNKSPEDFVKELYELVTHFLNNMNIEKVIVFSILHRVPPTIPSRYPVNTVWFNARVDQANRLLHQQLSTHEPQRTHLWRLKGFWSDDAKQRVFCPDGCHLSDAGQVKLLHNIRAAVVIHMQLTGTLSMKRRRRNTSATISSCACCEGANTDQASKQTKTTKQHKQNRPTASTSNARVNEATRPILTLPTSTRIPSKIPKPVSIKQPMIHHHTALPPTSQPHRKRQTNNLPPTIEREQSLSASSSSSISSASDSSSEEDDTPLTIPEVVSAHCSSLTDTGGTLQGLSSTHGPITHTSTSSTTELALNQSVADLLQNSMAPATRSSYRNALNHFRNFHMSLYPTQPLIPTTTERLAQFIAACHNRNLQPSTITSYISAIAYVHKLYNFQNPADSFLIRKLLYSLRRRSITDKRLPFMCTHLRQLIAALPTVVQDIQLGSTFRAMFLTAFFGLLRVGEIALTSSAPDNLISRHSTHLHYNTTHSKVLSISITLPRYKHSDGQIARITLSRQKDKKNCPVRAILQAVNFSLHPSGPLFQDNQNHAISAVHFRAVLRRCATVYTGHSFRIGGATYAHSLNMAPNLIQKLGRWKSSAYLKYIRPTLLDS